MTNQRQLLKPKWISSIEAIGWDLDGTLYPGSEKLSNLLRDGQYKAVAEKHGWGMAKAQIEFHKRYRELGSHTKTLISLGIDGVGHFTKFWDEVDLSQFVKRDEKLMKLFESISDRRIFVLSNSNREDQIVKKLKLIGINPNIFEFLLSTVDVGEVKPDPKPFIVALEKLALQAEKVLFIGDRVSTDIMGAKRAGFRSCLVRGRSKEADISLSTVYDVFKLFK
jgi:HAD superfamily hydrolase (TIGR01549 family)